MAFTASGIFRAFLADAITGDVAIKLGAATGPDAPKVALYGNTGTPSKDSTRANSAYAVDQWVTANEMISGTWGAGGVVLGSPVVNQGTAGVVFLSGTNTTNGANVTLTNVYGCLVYDDTLTAPTAKQGICFNWFGGPQSVSAGTFTIVWSANGVFRFTL